MRLLSGNGTLSAPLRAYNNNIIDSSWKIEEEEHNKGFFCRTSHSSKGRTQKRTFHNLCIEPYLQFYIRPLYILRVATCFSRTYEFWIVSVLSATWRIVNLLWLSFAHRCEYLLHIFAWCSLKNHLTFTNFDLITLID